VLGHKSHGILDFDEIDSHWRPVLTVLHDEEVGANHSINRASRQLAMRSLKRIVVGPKKRK
jgi:hypothetical protein